MELLGVGPTEFLFVIIIILIVIGPKDLAKTGTTIGKWLNSLIQSDTWKVVQKTSREIRHLPTNLMREANLEEFKYNKDEKATNTNAGTWQGKTNAPPPPVKTNPSPEPSKENIIQPPVILPTPADPPSTVRKAKPATRNPKTPTTKKTSTKSERKTSTKKSNE